MQILGHPSGVPPTHQVGLKTLQVRLENIKDDPEYIKAKSDDKRFIDNTSVLRLLDTVPPQHLIAGQSLDPPKFPHSSKASEEFILSHSYHDGVTAADASDSVVLEVDQKKIKGCSKEINCTAYRVSSRNQNQEIINKTSHKTCNQIINIKNYPACSHLKMLH